MKIDYLKELKSIVKSAREFYHNCYAVDYKIEKTEKFLWFFTKKVTYYDMKKAEDDSRKNNCYCYYGFSEIPRFTISSCIEKYEKILSLSQAETFYLDDELQSALNGFLSKDI